MIVLRNCAFYAAFYSLSAVLVIVSLAAPLMGGRTLDGIVKAWSRWHRWCVVRLLGIRVVLEGAIPEEPVLFAIKHESFFEAIDTPNLFDRPGVFAKRELFAIPGWGRSALAYGLIPVAREDGARALRAMIATARQRVGEGRALVLFPEGTRVTHGEAPPLLSGFAGIYKLLGLPVMPIAVDSGPLYHRGLKRPGTITYRVGERVPAGLTRGEAERRVHEAINALNAAGGARSEPPLEPGGEAGKRPIR